MAVTEQTDEGAAATPRTLTVGAEAAGLLDELHRGLREVQGDERSPEQLVENAIARVHRGFFGLSDGGGPTTTVGPFCKWASDRPAEVLLRQVDPTTFCLSQPFRYRKGTTEFRVPEDDVTDLASVPRFLTWLVPRYGRHTLPALLHDHLQDVPDVSSERADEIFRDAMGGTGVPLARRWLIWSAVALRTQWNLRGLRRVRAGLWVVAFALTALVLWPALIAAFVGSPGWGTAGTCAAVAAGTLAAPLVLSVLWGRLWRLGAFGGVALIVFALPVLLVLIALGAYFCVELVIERVAMRRSERNPVLTRDLR